MTSKIVLNLGAGKDHKQYLPGIFKHLEQVTVDADEQVKPDVCDDIRTLSKLAPSDGRVTYEFVTREVHGIFSSHTLEHLFAQDAYEALVFWNKEVLVPGGLLVLVLPDIRAAAEKIMMRRPLEPIYISPAGPIRALDILYAHPATTRDGNPYAMHRTGFCKEILEISLCESGYIVSSVLEMGGELIAYAHKPN